MTFSGNVAGLGPPTTIANEPGLDFFPILLAHLMGRANPANQPAIDSSGRSRAGDLTPMAAEPAAVVIDRAASTLAEFGMIASAPSGC